MSDEHKLAFKVTNDPDLGILTIEVACSVHGTNTYVIDKEHLGKFTSLLLAMTVAHEGIPALAEIIADGKKIFNDFTGQKQDGTADGEGRAEAMQKNFDTLVKRGGN